MKRVQDFKFKDYKWLNYQNYILTLKTSDSIAEIKPGNFAELKIPNAPDVFLRRPLSILDVDHDKKHHQFLCEDHWKRHRKTWKTTMVVIK